jgi:hypothetical protein
MVTRVERVSKDKRKFHRYLDLFYLNNEIVTTTARLPTAYTQM